MSESSHPPSAPHGDDHHHGADPAPVSMWEDTFYDGKQTALVLGSMGLGFLVLMVLLYVVGS
ncbi:MAG: hypothetical protein AAGI91_13680 [Bacteroidota bacterium]